MSRPHAVDKPDNKHNENKGRFSVPLFSSHRNGRESPSTSGYRTHPKLLLPRLGAMYRTKDRSSQQGRSGHRSAQCGVWCAAAVNRATTQYFNGLGSSVFNLIWCSLNYFRLLERCRISGNNHLMAILGLIATPTWALLLHGYILFDLA